MKQCLFILLSSLCLISPNTWAVSVENQARYDKSVAQRESLAAEETEANRQKYLDQIEAIHDEQDKLRAAVESQFQESLGDIIRRFTNHESASLELQQLNANLLEHLNRIEQDRKSKVAKVPLPQDLLSLPSQFGCFKGYCWAYVHAFSTKADPWCYTQWEGVPVGKGEWASCSSNEDCAWEMNCGNNVLHYGDDLPRQFGCYKNYCWAYLKENSPVNSPWCYTQKLGVPHGREDWASCTSDQDCSWEMTCGNDNVHYGAD